MQLAWYGHSTWQVSVGDTRLVIDPMFDNPYAPVDPGEVAADYLLLTHGHGDHVADVGAFADRTIVSTPEITGWVSEKDGAEDTIGFNIGGSVACGDAFVTMVQAYHTNGIQMEPSLDAGVPTGLIISDMDPRGGAAGAGTSFYHAGDTALMSEMRDVIGACLQPDAAALPIGDHFTMGPHQAAIAVEWLGVDHAFPVHYNTFPPIEQDPESFVQAVDDGADVDVLGGGESFALSG